MSLRIPPPTSNSPTPSSNPHSSNPTTFNSNSPKSKPKQTANLPTPTSILPAQSSNSSLPKSNLPTPSSKFPSKNPPTASSNPPTASPNPPTASTNPLNDPSTAPYVPSTHTTSNSPHPGYGLATRSPRSPASSTDREGEGRRERGRPHKEEEEEETEAKEEEEEEVECQKGTQPEGFDAKGRPGGQPRHGNTDRAQTVQGAETVTNLGPSSETSHPRQKQKLSHATFTPLTSTDCVTFTSPYKQGKDSRLLAQKQHTKQSYGAFGDTSGLSQRSGAESPRNERRGNSADRNNRGSNPSNSSGDEDNSDGTTDFGSGSGRLDPTHGSGDENCAVDDFSCSRQKQKGSVKPTRDRLDASTAPTLPLSDEEDNDDDVDKTDESNDTGALLSEPPVTLTGTKPNSDKTDSSKSSEDAEKSQPQTGRKNFARLIGLYKRDLNKSDKSARSQKNDAEKSSSTGAVRKSSGRASAAGSDVTQQTTPEIQISTPAFSETSCSASSSTSLSSAPTLKSALVKSSAPARLTTTPTATKTETTTAATATPKLPNTAKHKVSFITGLRRFSREKTAFLRVDHTDNKPKTVPTTAPTYLFPARPLGGSSNESNTTGSGSQASTGSRRGGGRKLKVEFAVMESEVAIVDNNRGIRGRGRWGVVGGGGGIRRGGDHEDTPGGTFNLKDDVENDVAMLGGSRARFRQARLSLLGKPLNYKAHRRDMRYRRLQSRIYNFLERPKSWGSWLYHLAMFSFVIVCLTLGVLSSITELEGLLVELAVYLEIVMLLWILLELCLRVWSAGCRSRYQGKTGRVRFVRRPLCIIDMILILASVGTLVVGSTQEQFGQAVLSGLRFFQILRLVRMDRKGGTWKLLGSVVWAHRQELVTTLYIGLLGLVFSSYFVYLAEKDEPRREADRPGTYNTSTHKPKFNNFADAIWWGVVTLCTVGYGDVVPATWGGKVIASVSAILGISFFALPAGILGSGFALKVQQQQRQKHLNRRRVPAANLIQCLWRCYAADEHSMSTATWKPHMIPCPSPTSERTPRANTSFVSRFSTRRRDRSSTINSRDVNSGNTGGGGGSSSGGGGGGGGCHNSNNNNHSSSNHVSQCASGGGGGGGVSNLTQSPMTTRHNARRSAISASEEEVPNVLDSLVGRTWSHLSLATGLSEQRLQLDSLNFKKENSVSSIGKESEGTEDLDLSPRLTQLTEQHKKAIRAIRKIRYFVSRRKFREARRPYDVKDVIEQYSAGHVDMLGRIKNLQGRLDQILGRQGSKSKDVYESKICLASRIVKVERQVDDIETKVDLLVDMYKEDRKFLLTHIQHVYSGNAPPTDTPKVTQAPPTDSDTAPSEPTHQGTKYLSGFKPRPILIDKQFMSEPATPTDFVTGGTASSRLGARPGIQRNLSDLSQRIKKRVTYRGLPQNHHDPPSRAQSAACFPVSSLPPPPSPSSTCTVANTLSIAAPNTIGDSRDTTSSSPPSPPTPSGLNYQPHSPDSQPLPVTSILRTSGNPQSKTHPFPFPPTSVIHTSPNLSERPLHLSSPSRDTQFQYPALHTDLDLAQYTESADRSASPSPGYTSGPGRQEDGHENLISFTYDNGSLSKGQGQVHFDAVYYAKEQQHPSLKDDNQQNNQQQQQQQQHHGLLQQQHQHHHNHHHNTPPPGSTISSLMGTSLATVTEQRSTDSDSGQYLSDTCQSSPSRLPNSPPEHTDDEAVNTVQSPERHLSSNNNNNLQQPLSQVRTHPEFPPQLVLQEPIERPLSPPRCSSADSVCSETSSNHEDELSPFLPGEVQASRPSRLTTCSTSGRSGLSRQSSEVMTSPSTTSSQASLLNDSRSHVIRGNSQSNASFSPDALFDERETTFAREGAGSIS